MPKIIVHGDPSAGAATCAVALAANAWAPSRGALDLVGSGPGALEQLTPAARAALAAATTWVGYGPYLNRLEPCAPPTNCGLTGCWGRRRSAAQLPWPWPARGSEWP